MLDTIDHATDGRSVVVDRNVVGTSEAERFDGALVVLERIVDAARLRDVKLLYRHYRSPLLAKNFLTVKYASKRNTATLCNAVGVAK